MWELTWARAQADLWEQTTPICESPRVWHASSLKLKTSVCPLHHTRRRKRWWSLKYSHCYYILQIPNTVPFGLLSRTIPNLCIKTTPFIESMDGLGGANEMVYVWFLCQTYTVPSRKRLGFYAVIGNIFWDSAAGLIDLSSGCWLCGLFDFEKEISHFLE